MIKITIHDANMMKTNCTNATGTGFCNSRDNCLSYKYNFCIHLFETKQGKLYNKSSEWLVKEFNHFRLKDKLDKI